MAHAHHTIHGQHHHFGWDRDQPPVATVAPGETVSFDCLDAGGGHFTPESTVDAIASLDFAKVNPVTGPIVIDGAKPGDALKITVESFAPSGFGWTANIPGFGLLADDFPDPGLHLWRYAPDQSAPAMFGPGGAIPVRPFAGTIGVAPKEPGPHSVVPPRNVGGNMDIRDLVAGTVLLLPIEVEGAVFSVGDTHAAQGDGEVCGTAIESAMTAAFTFEIDKAGVESPRFVTPGPVTRHIDANGYDVTTGVGPSLMEGAKDAVRRMIDLLCATRSMAPLDAYMLCSVAGDLRISEIVDQPNWIVAFYFPRAVFA